MAEQSPEATIRDNAGSLCYDALVGAEIIGTLVYQRSGSRIIFMHTIVEPEFRGRGIATKLVREALDDVRARGLTVSNYCGFVAEFIAANPGYADLIDAGHPGLPRRR